MVQLCIVCKIRICPNINVNFPTSVVRTYGKLVNMAGESTISCGVIGKQLILFLKSIKVATYIYMHLTNSMLYCILCKSRWILETFYKQFYRIA